jgi:hypothetical protein
MSGVPRISGLRTRWREPPAPESPQIPDSPATLLTRWWGRVIRYRVIGPSRAFALGALLAELQEPAEYSRAIVVGLGFWRSAL